MALALRFDDSFYGRILGSPSASKGGKARARSLTKTQRKEIAIKAAEARWGKRVSLEEDPKYAYEKDMPAEVKKMTEKQFLASINKPIKFFD